MVDSSDNITELYTHSQYENHRLKKVTMPNGQAYNYGYSVNGLLSSVSAGYSTRQGNSVSHIQNENIQYEYKDGFGDFGTQKCNSNSEPLRPFDVGTQERNII